MASTTSMSGGKRLDFLKSENPPLKNFEILYSVLIFRLPLPNYSTFKKNSGRHEENMHAVKHLKKIKFSFSKDFYINNIVEDEDIKVQRYYSIPYLTELSLAVLTILGSVASSPGSAA